MLYGEEGTCADWTSTGADEYARCGFSWPRGIGSAHWISTVDSSGCEAGVDLTEDSGSGLPGVTTIGNGGGYGGFYCFALTP